MDILSGLADIYDCKSSANNWCVIEREPMMVDEGLIYMDKSIRPRTHP